MTTINEVAPDIFRIATYLPDLGLGFNQFLVRDEEPLLFHTGLRLLFPVVRDAVATVLDPARLRWISFSHFEADECGALNEWLALAPAAEPACSVIGAIVNVGDYANRPPRALADGKVLTTGQHRLRFLQTTHVPHGWDAGLMFDEVTGTLLCSDLLHQTGDGPATIEFDPIDLARSTLQHYQAGPLTNYLPYTPLTDPTLQRLAALKPKALATMHGSTYVGDGERVLRDLAVVLRETYGG